MSADNKPKYERIGFMITTAAAAVIAALVYIGGFKGKDSEFFVETYYDNPVSGLSVGSSVNFRGVKIGEVRDIMLAGLANAESFAAVDAQRVRILIAIDIHRLGIQTKPSQEEIQHILKNEVERGLRATVVSSGITGLSHIELNILENPPSAAGVAWIPVYPLIPPAPSLMESLSDTATKLMNHINKTDFASIFNDLRITAESASRLAANADALLESQRSEVGSLIESAKSTVSKLEELATKLENNPSLIISGSNPEPLPETSK